MNFNIISNLIHFWLRLLFDFLCSFHIYIYIYIYRKAEWSTHVAQPKKRKGQNHRPRQRVRGRLAEVSHRAGKPLQEADGGSRGDEKARRQPGQVLLRRQPDPARQHARGNGHGGNGHHRPAFEPARRPNWSSWPDVLTFELFMFLAASSPPGWIESEAVFVNSCLC